jgi:hypothetical protein
MCELNRMVLVLEPNGQLVFRFEEGRGLSYTFGNTDSEDAVTGRSGSARGVVGESTDQAGVVGVSNNFVGIWGESYSADQPGIFGKGPRLAAYFEGDVVVTGDVILSGADLAEDFQVVGSSEVEPGTVMVLDGVDRVRVSSAAYDRKVVGVVSGAGEYRPAVLLDHRGRVSGRQSLALVGKVLCKVDASFAPVEVGDLLTTSPTQGHAMKVTEADRGFGAVLGKAMAPLVEGRGFLPMVVTLQ